jgi:L-2-hydroxyglutarate oxidase
MHNVDVAVVGGGVVGLATARAIAVRGGLRVAVLEAEDEVARHQSGRNSGVLHTGLYYRPGSLKARYCREGRRKLMAFCAEKGIRVALLGKLVVATREEEVPRLDELERRGLENGLTGLARLTGGSIRNIEPHAAGLAALYVPEAAVVDYAEVARAIAADLEERGGKVLRASRLLAVDRSTDEMRLVTASGPVTARLLVACAGLQADRVARLCGLEPGIAIVPFRGDYFEIVPERRDLVRGLLYPVPDPLFPFLGVHFTRRVDGTVDIGPNAVLSLHRTGYSRFAFSLRDTAAAAFFPGLWRFLVGHLPQAIGELRRSFDSGAFLRSAQELLPELRAPDMRRAGCGIRAQAMSPDGTLVDDFAFLEEDRMVHVLNAPSPAATASFEIGEEVARRALRRLGA